MKSLVFTLIASILGCLCVWLLGEGVVSIARLHKPGISLAVSLVDDLVPRSDEVGSQPANPDLYVLSDYGELQAMVPDMRASGTALGNSPFNELKTEEARIGTELDGCLVQKADLRKEMAFLRTTLFDRFDPLNAFYSLDAPQSERLKAFIDRYAFRRVNYTTDHEGYRITVPQVTADRTVLIAGASIANGLMLDDAETISSQMQAKDPSRRYVNIGVGGGGKMDDIVCSLDRAEKRFKSIDEVIFILGEIQQEASNPYGTPDKLIGWLSEFRKRTGLRRLVFVYMPYVYNSMPDVTRRADDRRSNFPYYNEEKAGFMTAARAAGFEVVDFLDATQAIRREAGSQFAPFLYYLDRDHLSKIGVAKLVEMIGRP